MGALSCYTIVNQLKLQLDIVNFVQKQDHRFSLIICLSYNLKKKSGDRKSQSSLWKNQVRQIPFATVRNRDGTHPGTLFVFQITVNCTPSMYSRHGSEVVQQIPPQTVLSYCKNCSIMASTVGMIVYVNTTEKKWQ